MDASRQRNTRDENATIKAGSIPEDWKQECRKNKLRQKDTDARWTKKGNEVHYLTFRSIQEMAADKANAPWAAFSYIPRTEQSQSMEISSYWLLPILSSFIAVS